MAMDRYAACRGAAHYLFAFFVLSFFGGQVCNYLCTLDLNTWMVILGGTLCAMFALRWWLIRRFVETRAIAFRSRWQYGVEFFLFLLGGGAVMVFNFAVYGFPFGSGMKAVLGFLTIGFFAAADLALDREYRTAVFSTGRESASPADVGYFSLPRKFAAFAIGCALLVAGVVALLVIRGLELLDAGEARFGVYEAKYLLMQEIVVVLVVLLALLINISVSYARNLRWFFAQQTRTLREVTQGRLDAHVPVSTVDEFGVIAAQTNVMIRCLQQRTARLEATQDATIVALAELAERRDNETGQHIRRTQAYIRLLAEHLRDHERFAAALTLENIELLQKSAPLHDIGKVGIPDAILLKPGRLTPEEFAIMKLHTLYGAQTLQSAQRELGADSFLRLAEEIAYTHHEKWDGSGYPRGLRGDEIPVSGRLMALADVYDALISKRCYKEAFTSREAGRIIAAGRGTHFDPEVADAFFSLESEFAGIAARLADAPPTEPASPQA